MDETKIIEAIQQFGTPVWEATRIKIKLLAVSGFVGSGVVAFCLIQGLIRWKASWEKRLLEGTHCSKCEAEDPSCVRVVYWVILSVFVSAFFLTFFEGAFRWFATDYYAYKALLP